MAKTGTMSGFEYKMTSKLKTEMSYNTNIIYYTIIIVFYNSRNLKFQFLLVTIHILNHYSNKWCTRKVFISLNVKNFE
jgi:hypothetical protein